MDVESAFSEALLSAEKTSFDSVLTWWKSKNIKTEQDLRIILDNFKILFSCNNAAIEGSSISYHTTREVFEDNSVSSYSGDIKELFEVQNQKFAYESFCKAFGRGDTLSVELIRKFHKVMLYGCYDDKRWGKGERPGHFKVNDYCVGLTDEGSLPEEVEHDLIELVSEVNEVDVSKDVLTVSSYFHLNFEAIHPFADGNGRVGRLLMNYLLITNGYPPAVIFDDDKETYYMALEVFDRTGEVSGFRKFLEEQIIRTWSTRVEKSLRSNT